MKTLLAAGVALTALSTAAMAEPVRLAPQQMDAVTAGAFVQFQGAGAAIAAPNPLATVALVGGVANIDVKPKSATGSAAVWAVCSGAGCAAAVALAPAAAGTSTVQGVLSPPTVINIGGILPITVVYQYAGVAALDN